MTTDIRTPQERAYDAQRDGSAYTKPELPAEVASGEMSLLRYVAREIDQAFGLNDDEPADALTAVLETIEQHFEPEPEPAAQVRDNILLGHIDGSPVLAHYMDEESDYQLAWATVEWNGISISTDGDSYLNLPGSGAMVGDMTPAEWPLIKALAQTDVCERLMALALRYPHFLSVPPAAPAVTTERFVCDDELDQRCGQELGTDYRCGETLIYFPDDGSRPMLRAFDIDFNTVMIDRDLGDLIALLSDPRVQARRAQR